MTDDELARRTDANYAFAWSLLAATVEGGEARARDGLVVVATGLPDPLFNAAFVLRPLPDARRQLQEATAFFLARGLPYQVNVPEGMDPAAESACRDLGLVAGTLPLPGMGLEPIDAHGTGQEWPAPRGLSIALATDPVALEEHRLRLAANFGAPVDLIRRLLPDAILDTLDIELYVGRLEGQAVASSALVVSHRVAGIFNVATDKAYRGRGIGEALTRHAAARGAELGCAAAALQASAMGRPIYERMGFRVVSRYLEFRPASAPGEPSSARASAALGRSRPLR